ncbi:hypothetical protein LTR39_000509 [Cryomyces antarcticus]|nr:hypothetical protein LTR39_000509 [Cryomyces antarcticus]
MDSSSFADGTIQVLRSHNSHPDFLHLIALVFEAVLEVVCVSLPGYIVARQGMFDADAQKFVANLNVQLFTPCLIFTKLASQLNADRLVELAVIPLIFVVQTLVSYLCATGVSRIFRFKKRPKNFVIATGVFGNSNSLPISLVISLSKTLKGLHWDRIPGDNDDEVAARGILYLLIFQQLGQLVRWSWGYHVLLAPPDQYKDEDQQINSLLEQGRYRDDPDAEGQGPYSDENSGSDQNGNKLRSPHSQTDSDYGSGAQTPITGQQYAASTASSDSAMSNEFRQNTKVLPTPTNGNVAGYGSGNMGGNTGSRQRSEGHLSTFPDPGPASASEEEGIPSGPKGWGKRLRISIRRAWRASSGAVSSTSRRIFSSFPAPVQKGLSKVYELVARFLNGVKEFMNPPLYAMLAAIIVASVPALQRLFFSPGSFVANSVTRAVSQSGGVAVPLILVVLGANLARNTLPQTSKSPEDDKEERNLLIASLISRMLLPTIVMAPLLAVTAKYVPVSILDDPIFVIVCFLLTGAPSALQLAQICQINNVYMGAMSRLLFQSYVIWYDLTLQCPLSVALTAVQDLTLNARFGHVGP